MILLCLNVILAGQSNAHSCFKNKTLQLSQSVVKDRVRTRERKRWKLNILCNSIVIVRDITIIIILGYVMVVELGNGTDMIVII